MKLISLTIAMVGMLACGTTNAAFTYLGYMPGANGTARNDVHPNEISQIESFLGMSATQHLTKLDKWEQNDAGSYSEHDVVTVTEYVHDSDGWSGIWESMLSVGAMTVKAGGMIGIWGSDLYGDTYNFADSANVGDWDTVFTMPPYSKYKNGAQMSHITFWSGENGGSTRIIDPPTVPAPATLLLMVGGLLGLLGFHRKRKNPTT